MTLRARLLISLGILVAVALLVAGALVVQFTRAGLVNQLDDELRSASTRPAPLGQGGGPGGRGPGRNDDDPTGRRICYMLLNRNGTVVWSYPSGRGGNPDPLPSPPDVTDASTVVGRIVERPAVEGDLRYRLVVERGPQRSFVVLAAPLNVVDEPMGALIRNLVLVGAAVLATVIIVAWLIIRRGLRPLETVAVTADAIASGDLAHRAELPHDRSEIGRLGSAFDRMLDQIQAAFEEQRAALESKDRSERRLRQFVADASHELRTPLTAVRGYADLYRAGGLEDDEALERAMTRIATESRRMGGLVEDLLLLARLDQGRPLRREPVNVSQLVEDAVGDARAIEPNRPIAADVGTGVRVTGDEDRLRQVIGNLLANVRVHTPPGTALDVSLRVTDGQADLQVVDHGPGIGEPHAEHVFDRFYRADPARSRDRGGSGLGLSIAASVVAAHGGRVTHHPTPGGGATFVVTLPTEALPADSQPTRG
jgi:two-component system, OmpR family, sensor kinase